MGCSVAKSHLSSIKCDTSMKSTWTLHRSIGSSGSCLSILSQIANLILHCRTDWHHQLLLSPFLGQYAIPNLREGLNRPAHFSGFALSEHRSIMTCDSPADPNRVGPSQPPLNFVDGNGYIVLGGW